MARDQSYLGNRTSTVLGRKLGGELLEMREESGLTQGEAAKALSASTAKVHKMERGWVPMRDPDIRALCELYDMTDQGVVNRLLQLARTDRDRRKAKGWWNKYPEIKEMAEYIAMEDVATRIRTCQLNLIPGLFQTASYTRAMGVVSHGWDTPQEIEHYVEMKRSRQRRLISDSPLAMWAVITEAALRQLIGGPEVMRGQLDHLLELSRLPHIDIQVLPFRAGAYPCMTNGFNIISFSEPGALDVVYSETSTAMVWMEDEDSARMYTEWFDHTARLSLTPHDSNDLIESIIKGI